MIRRCQQGDLQAYETVYRQFEQPLLQTGRRMLGSVEEAEDAVQLTFLKLYRGIHNYRFKAQFSTYLYRIMLNVCFDLSAKKRRVYVREIPDSMHAASPTVDLRMQLEEAIGTLPERMRACFVLFAVQGFRQREIADMLDLTVGAVKSHIFQAKTRLRQHLSDTEPRRS